MTLYIKMSFTFTRMTRVYVNTYLKQIIQKMKRQLRLLSDFLIHLHFFALDCTFAY